MSGWSTKKRMLLHLLVADTKRRNAGNRVSSRTEQRNVKGGGFWRQSRRRKLLLLYALSKIRFTQQGSARAKRRWGVRPTFALRRAKGAWHSFIPTMRNEDPEKFFNYFRMPVHTFDELLALLEPHLQLRSFSEHIGPGERLAVTLRYLASGDSMRSISYAFLIAPPTVSLIIRHTCQVIWRVLGPQVFEKYSPEFWEKVASDYERLWNFPNCVGAIDGKHCNVQAFANSGSTFYNYKGAHSVVLMALCDAQYKFIYVDIGAKGRQSDGGVFKNCKLGKDLASGNLLLPPPKCLPRSNKEVPFVIVADEAFPLQTNIMRPFPGAFLPDERIIFNYRLSRARRVVENAFGILSARWRILRRNILATVVTANAIIQATTCLHNFLIMSEQHCPPGQRQYAPPRFVDSYDPDGSQVPGLWRSERTGTFLAPLGTELRLGSRNYSRDAYAIRQMFVDFFMDEGQVSWQWKKLPRRDGGDLEEM